MSKSALTVAISQPETLPWLGFIDKLRQCDVMVILDSVQFEKNYYQNRNKIRTPTAQGWAYLTVPVLIKGRFGQRIDQVEINSKEDWQRKHLTTLELNYHSAPCFANYFQELKSIYVSNPSRLVDFNIPIINWLVNAFKLKRDLLLSSKLKVTGSKSALVLAICKEIGATTYFSGISGKDYLDLESFEQAGIGVRFQEFYHPIYPQCYKPFVPSLSSIDLLFNCGERSLEMLSADNTNRLNYLVN